MMIATMSKQGRSIKRLKRGFVKSLGYGFLFFVAATIFKLHHAACTLTRKAHIGSSPALEDAHPIGTKSLKHCNALATDVDNLSQYLQKLSPNGKFQGRLIFPTEVSDYKKESFQYASHNYPQRTRPSFVTIPANEADVQALVRFAKHCYYTVAVRSGGHSYLGLSSCDSTEKPCLQIDVQRFDQTLVLNEDQIAVGAGVKLDQLASFLRKQNRFLPAGECAKVGLGGHVQTGGFGAWSRPLGSLASRVDSFRIVTPDGEIRQVTAPNPTTTPLNDDLFYSVLGGASGSWGVLTEISFDTFQESDHFAVFWQISMTWNDDGAAQMVRTWAELANQYKDDHRWGTHISFLGFDILPGLKYYHELGASMLEFEGVWVSPLGEANDYNPSFFQKIIDACIGCEIRYAVNASEPVSYSLDHRFLTARTGSVFPKPWVLKRNNFQQAKTFPTPDEAEQIARLIGQQMPTWGSTGFFDAAISTAPALTKADNTRSLPFQQDSFGVGNAFYSPSNVLMPPYDKKMYSTAAKLQDIMGDDHRMFWGAYGKPDLVNGDWKQYFESESTYERLQKIKGKIDPLNLFQHKMSMPLPKTPIMHNVYTTESLVEEGSTQIRSFFRQTKQNN